MADLSMLELLARTIICGMGITMGTLFVEFTVDLIIGLFDDE
jgi:hypothetical protein